MSLDDSEVKQPSTASSTNEMAGLIASKDWSTTALGHSSNWSPSLKLIVGIMTASGFPMAVRWGPEFILIYNDGYRTFLEVGPGKVLSGLGRQHSEEARFHNIDSLKRLADFKAKFEALPALAVAGVE